MSAAVVLSLVLITSRLCQLPAHCGDNEASRHVA